MFKTKTNVISWFAAGDGRLKSSTGFSFSGGAENSPGDGRSFYIVRVYFYLVDGFVGAPEWPGWGGGWALFIRGLALILFLDGPQEGGRRGRFEVGSGSLSSDSS